MEGAPKVRSRQRLLVGTGEDNDTTTSDSVYGPGDGTGGLGPVYDQLLDDKRFVAVAPESHAPPPCLSVCLCAQVSRAEEVTGVCRKLYLIYQIPTDIPILIIRILIQTSYNKSE